MMQDQLEGSRKETEGIRELWERVEGDIEGLGKAKLAELGDGKVGREGKEVVEEGRDVWEVLEREFS